MMVVLVASTVVIIRGELQTVVADDGESSDDAVNSEVEQQSDTEGTHSSSDYSGGNDKGPSGDGNDVVPNNDDVIVLSNAGSNSAIGGTSTGTSSSSGGGDDYSGPGTGNVGSSSGDEDPLDDPDQPGSQCDGNNENPLQCGTESLSPTPKH